jgi:hypothetical protein
MNRPWTPEEKQAASLRAKAWWTPENRAEHSRRTSEGLRRSKATRKKIWAKAERQRKRN